MKSIMEKCRRMDQLDRKLGGGGGRGGGGAMQGRQAKAEIIRKKEPNIKLLFQGRG